MAGLIPIFVALRLQNKRRENENKMVTRPSPIYDKKFVEKMRRETMIFFAFIGVLILASIGLMVFTIL